MGMVLLAAVLFLHNRLYLHQDGRRETLWFLAFSLAYAALTFGILWKWYARFPRAHLATLFLGTDLLMISWLLVLSGGEKSWLFWIPIARVADQTNTSFRRALVWANLAPFAFLLAVGYVRIFEGRPVDGGEVLAKFLVLHIWCLYVAYAAKTAERLRLGKRIAETANRAKNAFLACVSHELRTPLNAILLYTELVKDDVLASGSQESVADLQRIHGSASHLVEIVTAMLEMAQLEAGQARLHLAAFNLSALLGEVVQEVQSLAEQQGNAVELALPAGPLQVFLDRSKVRQILRNLLSNAHRFTHQGRVRLEARVDGEGLAIEVRDTGVGIPLEAREAIFEPFTQGEEYFTRRHGGAGLGLAISRGYTRMMGGQLQVESEEGQGTTMRLKLPLPRGSTSAA
jgi:signal transduction histidine kinase